MAGRFITFEGGEGAGKSTHVALLTEGLRAAGIPAIETREPGGSPGAEEIRELLVHGEVGRWDAMTEALLHFAARHDHIERVIRPALEVGDWLICDRFADSTLAYQGYGHRLGIAPVEQLYALAVGKLKPDLTLILDLPVKVGLRRTSKRRERDQRYMKMGQDFHQRVRSGFREVARRERDRCILVDADRPVSVVQDEIWQHVTSRFLAGQN